MVKKLERAILVYFKNKHQRFRVLVFHSDIVAVHVHVIEVPLESVFMNPKPLRKKIKET
jgi:hypothetical protein